MKLRLRGDTLRLRLTRSEVESISQGRAVVEQTRFPDGTRLGYRLSQGEANHVCFDAQDNGREIRVEIEAESAKRWSESDEVGFSGSGPFTVGPMQVLIEKDFTCLTPREGEVELDTYPNPQAEVG